MHSKSYARQNRITGKITTGKVCNPSTKAPSEDQLAARSAFKNLTDQARAFIADSGNAAEVEKLRKAYRSQTAVGSFIGYVAKQIKAGSLTI